MRAELKAAHGLGSVDFSDLDLMAVGKGKELPAPPAPEEPPKPRSAYVDKPLSPDDGPLF